MQDYYFSFIRLILLRGDYNLTNAFYIFMQGWSETSHNYPNRRRNMNVVKDQSCCMKYDTYLRIFLVIGIIRPYHRIAYIFCALLFLDMHTKQY